VRTTIPPIVMASRGAGARASSFIDAEEVHVADPATAPHWMVVSGASGVRDESGEVVVEPPTDLDFTPSRQQYVPHSHASSGSRARSGSSAAPGLSHATTMGALERLASEGE
jgi:hypothetical protein